MRLDALPQTTAAASRSSARPAPARSSRIPRGRSWARAWPSSPC